MTIHHVVRLSFFWFHLKSRYWSWVYTFLQILRSNIHTFHVTLLVTLSLYIYLCLFLLCWQFMRHPFLQFSHQVCHLWLSMQQHSAFPLCLCCVYAICMYDTCNRRKVEIFINAFNTCNLVVWTSRETSPKSALSVTGHSRQKHLAFISQAALQNAACCTVENS